MYKRSEGLKYVSLEKNFIRLLISQGIMEFGDNFRLLTVTMLLLELTGSGLAAGFGLIITPIVGIILSPIAGVMGDRLDGKRFLSGLFLLQGVCITFFLHGIGLYAIYGVLTLLAGVQIIQEPVFRKMVRDSLQDSHIMVGNSLSVGVSGFSNLLGPLLGGLGIHLWGMDRMFLVSALCYVISSLVVLTLQNKKQRYKSLEIITSPLKGILHEIVDGMKYFWNIPAIRELGITGFAISFGTTSVNFAFYSLVFDSMGIGAQGWGFVLSLFYSTRLLAMLISVVVHGKTGKNTFSNFYYLLFFTCISWFSYGFFHKFSYITLALVIEGTAYFLFEIFLWTRLQVISDRTFMARISGVYNILTNGARIMGIAMVYVIIQFYNLSAVFIANGILLFIYALYRIVTR